MFDKKFLDGLAGAKDAAGAIRAVASHVGGQTTLDLDKGQGEKEPMDTLGNLVDKLATVNAKLWHNQEELYRIRKMDPKEFEAAYGKDLAGLHHMIVRICDINVQRAKLMDEIDKFLAQATGNPDVVREQHKIY